MIHSCCRHAAPTFKARIFEKGVFFLSPALVPLGCAVAAAGFSYLLVPHGADLTREGEHGSWGRGWETTPARPPMEPMHPQLPR